jgi:hypothetical protein
MVDCYIISRPVAEFVEPESSSAREREKIKHPIPASYQFLSGQESLRDLEGEETKRARSKPGHGAREGGAAKDRDGDGRARWEKAATEFLDVVREELAAVDSRLQPSTSRRQASTSRRRFLASRAARVAPPPRDLATAAVAVGFDPEG